MKARLSLLVLLLSTSIAGYDCADDKVSDGCETNADCSSTTACIDSECSRPESIACDEDSICNGYLCGFEGVCTFRCDFPSECALGYGCSNGGCEFFAASCQTDDDCSGGYACELLPGEDAGLCATACDTEEQCASGLTCDLGMCRDLSPGTCQRDSECVPGRCIENRCSSRCSEDEECASGALCDEETGACTF